MVTYEIISVKVAVTGFWSGNLRERDHLENPGLNGRIL
jgi:hypothetical protein